MIKFDRRLTPAIAAALGLVLAGLAAAGSQAGTTPGPLQCGVDAKSVNGMTSIQGQLLSSVPVEGAYTFGVVSKGPGGRSNVSQGGHFAAGADEPVVLGMVTLNGNAHYQVAFEVTVDGVKLDCAGSIAS
jgi:hypothetical protein